MTGAGKTAALAAIGLAAVLLIASLGGAARDAQASEVPRHEADRYFVDVRDVTNTRALEKMRHDAEKARAQEVIDAIASFKAAEAERIAAEQAEAAAAYEAEIRWEPTYVEPVAYAPSGSTATTLHDLLNGQGRAFEGGTSYTWYQHDLGNGPLDIPGETFDADGVSHDADGYIVVAADGHAKGEVIDTPYGEAKVYDSGSGYGNVDVYTRR